MNNDEKFNILTDYYYLNELKNTIIYNNKDYIIELIKSIDYTYINININILLLKIAIILKDKYLIKFLISKGIDTKLLETAYEEIYDKNKCDYYIIKIISKYIDIKKYIKPVHLFTVLNYYKTPLYFKSLYCFCKYVINKGININSIKLNGIFENYLYYAIINNDIKLIKLFVKNGIDLNPAYSIQFISLYKLNIKTFKYIINNNLFNKNYLCEQVLYAHYKPFNKKIVKYIIYNISTKDYNRKNWSIYYKRQCRNSKYIFNYIN